MMHVHTIGTLICCARFTLIPLYMQGATVSGGIQQNPVPCNGLQFKLTSTWVSYGDSFTAGVGASSGSWAPRLANLTGTTLINRAVSGTTMPFLTGQSDITDDPVKNPVFANYSSILMYGFNDVRNSRTLYNDVGLYHWMQTVLGALITLAVPQSKIIDGRNFLVKSGPWSNTSTYSFGVGTDTSGSYLEHAITGRYLAIRFTGVESRLDHWQIQVDGVVLAEVKRANKAVDIHSWHAYGLLVDMGSSSTYMVRITNLQAPVEAADVPYAHHIDFVCAFDKNDVLARNVLALSIPRFDFDFSGGSPWDNGSEAKRIAMNEAIKDCVRACRRAGLPVFFHANNVAHGIFNPDQVHWDNNAHQWVAEDLRDLSVAPTFSVAQ